MTAHSEVKPQTEHRTGHTRLYPARPRRRRAR
jgi:hypothetical protein